MSEPTEPLLRDAQISAFLSGTDWADASTFLLAGDASNRRYLRVNGVRGDAVLMDAPPDRGEDVRPFVAVTEWLLEQGLSAPELFATDAKDGFLLIEDLGDALYARHLDDNHADETMLYSAAVDLLVALAEIPAPRNLGSSQMPLPPYDMATLEREAALLTEWWLPAATGNATPSDLEAEYRELVREVFVPVSDAREVIVLRDYHAENLLWLPDRQGHAKVGLLDYQDALAGHAAYDLVSLLEDARRDTSPELQQAMLARYLEQRTDLNGEASRRDYALLGAQRNLQIVGIFARLGLRDGQPGDLDLIPRVWNHLMHDLSHPALASMQHWVSRHVPAPETTTLDAIRKRVGT